MSRPWRIARNILIGLLAFLAIAFLALIIVVQTDWFRNFVREKIVAVTEEGTGGKVEVGGFSFSPRALEAVVSDFVIHGKEPVGAAPFVRASRVQVNLRLFTSLRRPFDISYLGIEKPQVNVLVFADGTTNIPQPKDKKPETDKTILDTVVDLAVDFFQIRDGALFFNSQKQALDLKARNLRAQLWFNLVSRNYKGELSMEPVYAVKGRNTPVVFSIKLPVLIERTRIALENAKITTPLSDLTINGGIEDLNHPKTEARVNGRLALADLKNLGDLPIYPEARNVPESALIDANVRIADDRIQVNALRAGLGSSNIEASGTLKDPQGNGSLQFKTHLQLDELSRLAKVNGNPTGVVEANGVAKLDAANNYTVDGNIQARNLAITQGRDRISNVQFRSALHLDPQKLDLKGMNLSAFGGQFRGDASMEQFDRYRLNGTLSNLDIQTAARAFGQKQLPYDGVVSGPIEAEGSVKNAKSTIANARLSIAPGRTGLPVSGRLNARYNAASGDVDIRDSYIALPNSRLALGGSLNKGLNLQLTSRNFSDFLAAVPGKKPDIRLISGQAQFNGSIVGGMNTPRITGHLSLPAFQVEGRQFDSFAADLAAASNRASLTNAVLRRGAMVATANASIGLRNWSAAPNQPLQATARIANGDLADVMVLAGQPSAGYAGALSMNANIGGTIGNPTGSATLEILNGKAKDEPFDRLRAQVNLADQLITIPAATLDKGRSQITVSAEFNHPRDSMTTGHLHAKVQSNDVDLAQVQTLQAQRPNTGGIVRVNADITGNLANSEFQLASVNGTLSGTGFRFDGQNYGDVNAKATTNGQTVQYVVASNFAGSDLRVNGNTQLVKGYPTTADAEMRNLPIERILTIARRTDIPARGLLSGTAHASGTMDNPQGSVDLDLANAVLYDEPLDHVRARLDYLPARIDVQRFEAVAGPSRIEASGRFDHPAGNLKQGDLQFNVRSNSLDLARIRNIQKIRPGLGGKVQLSAAGAANVQNQTLLRSLTADVAATSLSAQGKNFGDLKLQARTAGTRTEFTMDSNLAGSTIHAGGNVQLAPNYPANAELTFKDVAWSRLQPLVGAADGQPLVFDASVEGRASVNGPLTQTEQLRGSLELAKVQVNNIPPPGAHGRVMQIANQGPVVVSLDRGTIQIASAHLTGPQTDINLTGTAAITQKKAMDLNLKANTNLSLLQNFSQDIYSSGAVLVDAGVRGTMDKPLVNGRIELQKASINYVDFPNGISNANGAIVFSGNTATLQNITAESGGGRLTLAGYIGLSDPMRLGVRAQAANVRFRTQQGVSVVVSSNLNVTGTRQSSLVSGTAMINSLTYAPQSDLGSLLTRAAPPVQAPSAPNPLLDNMRLDVRVRTSSATAVQASLAQNLQVDADIRVRGTAARPAVLGRVDMNQGDLVFFGSKYRVTQGNINFYNPVRIEPVLNVTLETQAKGVNVVLNVTGPVDNMKLSYTSDPPLQFQEIVALLASGKTPTSDPTLLANQPSQPQQSFQQMGETALVSKAIADPLANRLQRVFGVSQLKIDPTFTTGSDLPQARVTLQQQVATNLTFTYITALNDPNTKIIRAEWALNPQWAANATRDENGIVSLNFTYRKQFR